MKSDNLRELCEPYRYIARVFALFIVSEEVVSFSCIGRGLYLYGPPNCAMKQIGDTFRCFGGTVLLLAIFTQHCMDEHIYFLVSLAVFPDDLFPGWLHLY